MGKSESLIYGRLKISLAEGEGTNQRGILLAQDDKTCLPPLLSSKTWFPNHIPYLMSYSTSNVNMSPPPQQSSCTTRSKYRVIFILSNSFFQEGIVLSFLDVKEDSKTINLTNVMTQAHPNDTMVNETGQKQMGLYFHDF